ncbi:MAG: PilT/PilU family type 4a pilus ATPase [Rickettsiales bacterium]
MPIQINSILADFLQNNASDCYLTVGAPPSFRFGNNIENLSEERLTQNDIDAILKELLTEEAILEFESTLEYNTAIVWNEARFRMNIFRQRKQTGIVLRRIRTDIPAIEKLDLPKIYGDLALEKRGLILLVGATGSGKSTSLAAMLEHRNINGNGHIVTIEDPIEFVHEHNRCIFTQRDVGIDTYSFGIALKNTLRQSPDVIVIGEIRDRETMEHALVFSETGHLCIATLHANNANQAIERVLNFFPEEKHKQIALNLSLNLKAILSQRLVLNRHGGRSIAVEILLNIGIIRDLIAEGRIKEIREHIEKGHDSGMQTFEQALFVLYTSGLITEQVAIAESDNPANLRLVIKQYEVGKSMGGSRLISPMSLDVKEKLQF